jgi:hypothetical protein
LDSTSFIELVVGAVDDRRRRGLEHDAALDAEHRVAAVHVAADAVLRAEGVERLDELRHRHALAVEADGHARLEADRHLLVVHRDLVERLHRHPNVIRDRQRRVVQRAAADRGAPQRRVDAVGGGARRDMDPLGRQHLRAGFARRAEVANRRLDANARLQQGAQGDVEPDLVVARGRAAVADGVEPSLVREPREVRRLQPALASPRTAGSSPP